MMKKEVAYICKACKERSPSIERQLKNYRWIAEFDSVVCAKCSRNFNFGYEVTDHESAPYECRASSQRSMNSPCESGDICKESRFQNQVEKDKPKQSYEILHNAFEHNRSLTLHKKTHVDLNDLTCEVCNKTFSDKSKLETHMMKHTKSRPHKCNLCNRAYKEESSLKSHMNKHDNNNPFKCKHCNLSCTSKYELAIHKAKHSEERPHKCSRCPSTFKIKGSFNRHMKRVHKENL